MITLQHASVFAMAARDASSNDREYHERIDYGMPWVLFPDAIRAYTGARQTSHFEETPDGGDVSWMIFPGGEILPQLTKSIALDVIDVHMESSKYPKCVIGEKTHIEVFDKKNYGHHAFHYIRMHLLQDIVLDDTLRTKLIDASERFDDCFTINHNRGIILNGQALRSEIAGFEKYGFLHLVGKMYRKTGILMNQAWFDKHVRDVLEEYYPADLAENTYKYMKIPDEIEEKINNLDFDSNEKIFDLSGYELIDVWDQMYAEAYIKTFNEM